MRIALFHDLPSGGAKNAVYEMVRRLVCRHTVDVFTLTSSEHSFCDIRPFVNEHRVYSFRPLPLFESPLGRLNQIQRWRDIDRLASISERIGEDIDKQQYDVVFVHPSMWTQAPRLLESLQTPSVYYVQESLRTIYEPKIARPYLSSGLRVSADRVDPLIWLYRRRVQQIDRHNTVRAVRLLTNSQFTATNIRQIYGRCATVVYLGVDTSFFRPLASVNESRAVLSVGALLPSKSFDFIIESLSHMPQASRPPLWIIANFVDIREQEYLEDLADDHGVILRIEENVSRDTLVERYNQANLVVYAPIREPFGLVPLEAMSCGTPVVGVAEGGVRETVKDGVTGLLVPRDSARFADALGRLLDAPIIRRHLGRQAREHVLTYWTWDRTMSTLEKALAQCTRTNNPMPISSAGSKAEVKTEQRTRDFAVHDRSADA